MVDGDVLEVKRLKKSYATGFIPKRTAVIRDVSFAVGGGEIVGFLGPNGAGKTTVLKIIVGLVRADEGCVHILGQDHRRAESRRRIGYLPENPVFYDFLTGEEFLLFAGRLAGMSGSRARARARELLEVTGLGNAGDVRVRKYSKGMLERLGMAQALMHDPELLLLDEPMSGMDPLGRYQLRDLIMGLKAEGKTLFFSTHILADVEMICDRIIILDRGRVRSMGRLSELLSGEIKGYEVTCRLDGEPPAGDGVRVLAKEGERLLVEIAHEDALGDFLSGIRRRGGRLLSLVPKKKRLEDLFIEEVCGGDR